MQSMIIEKSDNSPQITLDYENGFLEFEGKCHPENTFEFFKPIIGWIEEYFNNNTKSKTIINFKFEYFNSITTQTLFDIFDIISEGQSNGVVINWYYNKDSKSAYGDYEDFSDEFEDLNIKAIAV